MPKDNIVTSQRITDELKARAKILRCEMTPTEAKLWQKLRANRLGGFHFRRQQIIHGTIVDFYCHAADLVVELDGEIHVAQQDYDYERDKHLQGLGLHVLRFDNSDVACDIDKVLAIILDDCQKACKKD
jgi:very-short-patch-repair endonuclease